MKYENIDIAKKLKDEVISIDEIIDEIRSCNYFKLHYRYNTSVPAHVPINNTAERFEKIYKEAFDKMKVEIVDKYLQEKENILKQIDNLD